MKTIAHLVTGIIMILVLLFTFAILLLILLAFPIGSTPPPLELVWSGEYLSALDAALPALSPGACIGAT